MFGFVRGNMKKNWEPLRWKVSENIPEIGRQQSIRCIFKKSTFTFDMFGKMQISDFPEVFLWQFSKQFKKFFLRFSVSFLETIFCLFLRLKFPNLKKFQAKWVITAFWGKYFGNKWEGSRDYGMTSSWLETKLQVVVRSSSCEGNQAKSEILRVLGWLSSVSDSNAVA